VVMRRMTPIFCYRFEVGDQVFLTFIFYGGRLYCLRLRDLRSSPTICASLKVVASGTGAQLFFVGAEQRGGKENSHTRLKLFASRSRRCHRV
jgi:hypothetical protein